MRRLPTPVRCLFLLLVLALLIPVPAAASERIEAASPPSWEFGDIPCRLVPIPPLPEGAPVPEGCPGVRPGAVVFPSGCTLNFLFQGYRQDELGNWVEADRYVGTAGHCILDSFGEESWQRGQGAEAEDGDGRRIGEVAFAVLSDTRDFALIRLDSDVPASPSMCHWGGPTGLNEDLNSQTTVLRHFGQGMVLASAAPARTAVAAFGMPRPGDVFATGTAIFGDSGSGAISDDGRAVGVLVSIGVLVGSPGPNSIEAGVIRIKRLAPQLARAEEVLNLDLRLLTAPRSA